jgi:hypothetical protein
MLSSQSGFGARLPSIQLSNSNLAPNQVFIGFPFYHCYLTLAERRVKKIVPPPTSRHWTAAAALCMGCFGCASNDGGNRATPIASVEEYVARSNEVYCGKLRECCSAEDLAEHPLGAGSVDECAALLDGAAEIFAASIAAGRAEYDPEMGGACVETYAGLSCDDPRLHTSGSLPSCESSLRGRIPLGERCEQPYECVEGSCDFEMGGFCAPFKASGQPCLTHRDCESNYCDPFIGCGEAPPADTSICR